MNIKELTELYCSPIDSLLESSKGTSYIAMNIAFNLDAIEPGEAGRAQFHSIQQAYVLGLIERSHLCSITSLARASRWLTAASQLAEANNILGYAASVRGFLESAADAFDLMAFLPSTMAKSAPYWYTVLHNPAALENRLVGFGALEEKLIHYAYAGRRPKDKVPPPQHTNKTNAEYIRAIEGFGVPGAKEFYSECCELTHPASPSVMCFLDQSEIEITFNPDRDKSLIKEFEERHKDKLLLLAQCSINPALISIALLSRFGMDYPEPSDEFLIQIGSEKSIESLNDLEKFVSTYNPITINADHILSKLA